MSDRNADVPALPPLENHDRYNASLKEAAHQGFDSGVRAATGSAWINNFAKTKAPNIVFMACFEIGFSVQTRRMKGPGTEPSLIQHPAGQDPVVLAIDGLRADVQAVIHSLQTRG